MIHAETEAGSTLVFGHSKNHITSEALISCCLVLCVHACGSVLSSLNSCDAGCRWKMSQVLRGDIYHWWADTSEKTDRGPQKESEATTDNKRTHTLWSPDLVEEEIHHWPAQPDPSQHMWDGPVRPVSRKKDMMQRMTDNQHSHFLETCITSGASFCQLVWWHSDIHAI